MALTVPRRVSGGVIWWLVALVAGSVTMGGFYWNSVQSAARRLRTLPRVVAQRTDLHVTVRASGQVVSEEKTLIECELENLTVSSEGRSYSARGSSTIIDLIADGTMVRRGEQLCRLDSSAFEELVRQQEIQVQRAKADRDKAEFDLETAEISLKEYQEGLLTQQRQELQGQVTLAKADIQRQRDRLAWTERMIKQEYLSEGQLIQEEQSLLRSEINLERARGESSTLERFRVKTSTMLLEGAVQQARAELEFQELRLTRREEQLRKFQEQIERCTIRAPHDGFVIYANEPDNDPRVELGAVVYQKMDMFYLPDLQKMQVITRLHETVVSKVTGGMSARVRVEALPEYELEGRVVSVSPLPVGNYRNRVGEVTTFLAKVKLLSVPPGLLPGMSAEVAIETDVHSGSIVIPSTAVAFEEGREFCYVPGEGALERRSINTDSGTPQLVRVTRGLNEGESVVLDTSRIESDMPIVDSPVPIPATVDALRPSVVGCTPETSQHD